MNDGMHLDERYQVLPSMPADQFAALKADIEQRGVTVPIDITEDGYILDGHHRYRACVELGIRDFPTIVRPSMSEEERRAFARQNNALRRHLTRAQVRELVCQQLRETPEWANNRIGQTLGVDKKTVQTQRKRLETTGEIPKLTEFVGADGKQRKRPGDVMAPDAQELQKILSRLADSEHPEGFLSAEGMVVLTAPDPQYTEAELREWIIAVELERCIHPERVGWAERKGFRTPSEFFGPEGQRFMRNIGLPAKHDDIFERWQKQLAKYDGKSSDELRAMSQGETT